MYRSLVLALVSTWTVLGRVLVFLCENFVLISFFIGIRYEYRDLASWVLIP